jgi:hypothetical protein
MKGNGNKKTLVAEDRKKLTKSNFDGYDKFETYVRRDQRQVIKQQGQSIDPTGLRKKGYEFDHIVPAKEAYLRGWNIGKINDPSNFQMMLKSDNAAKGAGAYRGKQSMADFWRPRTQVDRSNPGRFADQLSAGARNLNQIRQPPVNQNAGGVSRIPNAMQVDQRSGGVLKRRASDTSQSGGRVSKKPKGG